MKLDFLLLLKSEGDDGESGGGTDSLVKGIEQDLTLSSQL